MKIDSYLVKRTGIKLTWGDYMIKRALPKTIAVVFGLLVGLFLAEMAARIFYPLPSDLNTAEVVKIGVPPTYIQYVDRMPWNHSVTRYSVEGEYTTTVSINGKGLRGPEIPYEKPDGEFRILYLGDSYVEAVQMEFEDIVYHQLEALLSNGPKRYKVIGAGNSGWGTDQAYQYYLYEGRRYQPDLVIYQFVINDVSDNARDTFSRSSGLRQHFSIEDEKLIRRDMNIMARPSYRYELAIHRHLLLSSRLYALMRDVWRGEGGSFLAQPVYTQIGPTSTTEPNPQLFIYQKPYSDDYNAAWELTEAIISEWSAQVREDGALFAVVSVPGRWAIYEEDWLRIPERYPNLVAGFDKWYPDKPDEYLSDITRRYDIPYLPLTAAFREYAVENSQKLYFRQDGHWTKAGHTLAAQTIFEWLLEQSPSFNNFDRERSKS